MKKIKSFLEDNFWLVFIITLVNVAFYELGKFVARLLFGGG